MDPIDTETTDSTPAPESSEPASRRDVISAAFEAAENPPDTTSAPTADAGAATKAPQPGASDATTSGRERDAQGRFAPKADGTQPPKSQAASKASSSVAPPATALAPKESPAPGPELKAPQSWKPLAREKWGSLPPEVQQEAHRIDSEVRQVMQRAAVAEKNWAAFQEATRPFETMIRAEGVDPVQAAQNLLQTAAALRTLPPWPKHQLLANILTTHGADLNLLAKALEGQQPAPGEIQQQPAYRDPRLDQVIARLEAQDRQRQEYFVNSTVESTEAWGKDKPWFEDLRADMADFHELAAKRGTKMSLEESYQRALALHPELQELQRQKDEAAKLKAAQPAIQRAKVAASSIRTSPAGPMNGSPNPKDRRSLIAAAMDSMEG